MNGTTSIVTPHGYSSSGESYTSSSESSDDETGKTLKQSTTMVHFPMIPPQRTEIVNKRERETEPTIQPDMKKPKIEPVVVQTPTSLVQRGPIHSVPVRNHPTVGGKGPMVKPTNVKEEDDEDDEDDEDIDDENDEDDNEEEKEHTATTNTTSDSKTNGEKKKTSSRFTDKIQPANKKHVRTPEKLIKKFTKKQRKMACAEKACQIMIKQFVSWEPEHIVPLMKAIFEALRPTKNQYKAFINDFEKTNNTTLDWEVAKVIINVQKEKKIEDEKKQKERAEKEEAAKKKAKESKEQRKNETIKKEPR